MAESLGVLEITFDNQLIAYLIRDTLTPYCAVIAVGITNQQIYDYMVDRLENCPCETQWWLIACNTQAQLSWVDHLALRFTGQVMISKACVTNAPHDVALELSKVDTLEHNEILHLGHLMLTIQYGKERNLRVTLLVCDNTVFCLPFDAIALSPTGMGNVLKQSSVKWDKFSVIYSPSISAAQSLWTSKFKVLMNITEPTYILKN